MKIVLDANVICGDYHLSGAQFRIFLEGIALVPGDIVVPEVVIDEVVNRYREDLEDILESVEQEVSKANKLLGRPGECSLPDLNPITESTSYKEKLLSILQRHTATIQPYPPIEHKTVVERDLQRKRPFKRNGAGYRDTLIWESIRRMAQITVGPIVFITSNSKDFGHGPRPIPELGRELTNPDRFEIIANVAEFNARYIQPRLEMANDVKERLQKEAGTAFDVPKWIRANLLDLLRDEENLGDFIGVPERIHVWPSEVLSWESLWIDEVERLPAGGLVVRVRTRVQVEFSIDVDWEDYAESSRVRDWVGHESEPFEWLSTWSDNWLEIGMVVILDKNAEDLEEWEIRSLEGPDGKVEYG